MTDEYIVGDIVSFNFENGLSEKLEKNYAVIVSKSKNANSIVLLRLLPNSLKMSNESITIDSSDLKSGSIPYSKFYCNEELDTVSCINSDLLRVGHLKKIKIAEILKKNIHNFVTSYYDAIHDPSKSDQFHPGISHINYAGRCFSDKELINLTDSALDFWLTNGKYTEQFETDFSNFLGVKYCSIVNSGSSANLLALMALTSQKLKEKRIIKGDEVISVAAGFPTTIAPIIQAGAVPVFVDIKFPDANIDANQLEKALTTKTKAVMIAHTLGFSFDMDKVKSFCEKNDLWLIEDNCDALGSKCFYAGEFHYTGTVGDIGTSSFYPPHHITMGEGGAVYTNNLLLKRIINSMRDWGRDCWCSSGHDNSCQNRFNQQFGSLPFGYDHKYVYSHFGYNLKATDMQAAVGCAQLNKISTFTSMRKVNHKKLLDSFKNLTKYFILPEPNSQQDPSPFGFLLTIKDEVSFTRNQLSNFLEERNIQTRNLFAGNILRHPCFEQLKDGIDYRVIGNLANTDKIMNDSLWIGVYPGMTLEMLNYMIETFYDFIKINEK